MRWRRAAITACTAVAVLAGVVGAAVADRDPSRLTSSDGSSGEGGDGASSAYRSSVTITLDGPTGPCASPRGAEPTTSRSRAPCGVVERLPAGTPEEDVLRRLGEPQRRRTLSEDGEAWDYSRYVDEARYSFAVTTLTFEGHRLVDSQEYVYK